MGFTASDIADWYDKKRLKRQKDLEEWVIDNPQWWAVGLATVGATSMEFLGGFVDVLRLGEGSAEGGWKGYGKDALRLVSILGPLGRLGKAGGLLARNVMPRVLLRFAVKPTGLTGPCTFQAANNISMLAKGKSIFLTLREMAKAKGLSLSKVKMIDGKYKLGAWIDDLLPVMKSAGMRASTVYGPKTVAEVVSLASQGNRVVAFAFKCKVKLPGGGEKQILHTVMALKDAAGQIRFADYGGKMFGSLEALISRWGTLSTPIELFSKAGGAKAVLFDANLAQGLANALSFGGVLVLEGVEAIDTDDGVDLALPVTEVAIPAPSADDPADVTVVEESFDNYVNRKSNKPLSAVKPKDAPGSLAGASGAGRKEPMRMNPLYLTGGDKAPPRSDWLTGVQFRLNHLGFGAGRVDGVMGPRTLRAITSFQRAYPPLKVDGIPGPMTQGKLSEVCGY